MRAGRNTRNWTLYNLKGSYAGGGADRPQTFDSVKEAFDPQPHLNFRSWSAGEDGNYVLVFKSDLPQDEAETAAQGVMDDALPGSISIMFEEVSRFSDEVIKPSVKDLGDATSTAIKSSPSIFKSLATIAVVVGGVYVISRFKK